MLSHRSLALLTCLLSSIAPANAAGPDGNRGDRMLDAYFRAQTKRIADACLADIKTKDDWLKRRPEVRRQFLGMMGLWPLPPRTDLHATITGKVDLPDVTIEKLHFQSLPGLYVTANLYLPKHTHFPAPTILYLCGHSRVRINGVDYGCKVHYQHQGAWFAQHGYVCLIVDTLQLGEVLGIHHGTYSRGMWWWHNRGYTPAGIECWSAMRALDYLDGRPEVDAKHIGVTGRSGGGATSWWIAAADDRPRCIVPVAGIADLTAHVVEGSKQFPRGVITGHCDCMYFTNTYRWDFAEVAALCAPRPLLLGNSDVDQIFPVPGYRRLAAKVRRIYDLLGAGDRFALLETAGPHDDTPELRLGAYRWMNRWLKGDTSPVVEKPWKPLPPQALKALDHIPDDAINATVQETFIKPAQLILPTSPEVARSWWQGEAPRLMDGLRSKVFHGWPSWSPRLNVHPSADVHHDGLRLRAYDFTSEENVQLRLWLLTAEKVQKPTLTVLTAVDEPGWQSWTKELGPAFRDALQLTQAPTLDAKSFAQNRQALQRHRWAFATIAPRGIGPTRWSEAGKPADIHIRRRFPLLGQTLDGQRVWDVRRAVAVLRGLPNLKGAPLWLQGSQQMAGIVLYAALFEPEVSRLDLWHPPASHRDGPYVLNVRQLLDLPQAMALALPRQVRIYVKDDAEAARWNWPLQLQRALGGNGLMIRKVPE